ncbi:FeoB-associated Cys-rich membrane protein [Magnetovibrio sp. PR-2]|uniref:FeoB-associated Cys-rich membrane protein n=1 Tax=Magnetovibrio sp. PR-2 TaxID=3120356 RepID=UPI003FA5CE7F
MEGIILTAVFGACVVYITRKGITRFSGNGGCSSSCSGCSSDKDTSSCSTDPVQIEEPPRSS